MADNRRRGTATSRPTRSRRGGRRITAGRRRTGSSTARKTRPGSRAARRRRVRLLRLLLCLALLAILGIALLALFLARRPKQQEYVISQACEEYRPLVEKVAAAYEVSEYVDLIMAVMMQESAGTVKDVMQASECQYNTEYPREPNGITDPEYSIVCGVQELKHALELAGSTGPGDMDKIGLALQAYNFGSDSFIAYTREHGHEQWSQETAEAFAQMASGGEKRSESMAADLGPWNYGDQFYPEHVLRYYKPAAPSQTEPKDGN